MAPAGVRAIGAAMADAGFPKTRIVLQQWNPRFRPSRMRLDGRVPDLFMVSSLEVHAAAAEALLRDARRIAPADRPLIVAGGPLCIYQPWEVFGGPGDSEGADVAVTGEEFVLLQMLERLLSLRGFGEGLRTAFLRARRRGLLDDIPGLVFARDRGGERLEELVDTGIQRLAGNLEELPDPALGFEMLERPSRGSDLSTRPLPTGRVRRHTPIASLAVTFGCRFSCAYCPIPAYNQRLHRMKSGQQVAREVQRLHRRFGFRLFSLVGGNFFNDRARARDVLEALAAARSDGGPLPQSVQWGTEATVCDTLSMRESFALAARAGMRALWMGVEDMTGALIHKGQTVENTLDLFRLLSANGISPMPMIMHHDAQPLYTHGSPYGLLNQVRLLRKAGAVDVQVLMETPAVGSRLYDEAYAAGAVFRSAAGRPVGAWMRGDNHVIYSRCDRPWRKQLSILLAYAWFYNPLRALWALLRPKTKDRLADALAQGLGMWGLVQTVRGTAGWMLALRRGPIRYWEGVPRTPLRMRRPDGGPAEHDPTRFPPTDAPSEPTV
jgi:radical SAM superfamily enzyme YgiQ (UPF0313 family)